MSDAGHRGVLSLLHFFLWLGRFLFFSCRHYRVIVELIFIVLIWVFLSLALAGLRSGICHVFLFSVNVSFDAGTNPFQININYKSKNFLNQRLQA